MTTHQTPANVTPEQAYAWAATLILQAARRAAPGFHSEEVADLRDASAALRNLADQVSALTAAKRASEEREAILAKERDEAIDALEDARDNDTAQFEGLHELIGDVGKHLGFVADDYPVSAQDIIDAIEAERNALAERLRVAEAENAELRFAYATVYAGVRLYMDDGELQDASAHPFIDFKRDPWEVVRAKLAQRAALAAQPAGQGYTAGGTVMRVEGEPAEPSTGWDSPGPTP